MTRTEAITRICERLRLIDGGQSPWNRAYTFHNSVYEVVDHYRWIDDITNFPSIQCVGREETITHRGGGERWVTLAIDVRGFTHDTEVTERGESLADDIEHVVDHFTDPNIEDLRVLTVQTDEGLNEPWGVVILQLVATYKR